MKPWHNIGASRYLFGILAAGTVMCSVCAAEDKVGVSNAAPNLVKAKLTNAFVNPYEQATPAITTCSSFFQNLKEWPERYTRHALLLKQNGEFAPASAYDAMGTAAAGL